MIDGRRNDVPRIRSLLTLCGLMLCVIFGASYLTYRQNATAIRQSAEKRLTRDVLVAKAGVEHAMASLLHDMESWARQPVMVSIMDDDIDHEIAEFLAVIREQNNFLQEVSCIAASGEVLVTTNTSQTGKSVDSIEQLREKFEDGIRCEIVEADNGVIVTAPIFWEFDERELIGVLQARIAFRAFLTGEPEWWVGITDASGRVVVQSGPVLPKRLDLASSDETYPGFGRVIRKTAPVEHPTRVIAPAWLAVTAQQHQSLFSELDALRSVAWGTSIGSALVAVVLIMGFTRRQRSLVERLAERGETLQAEVAGHKRTMETLRESEGRHRAITECAQDAIITCDAEGIVRFWNPAAERIFGYTATEAVRKNLMDVIVPPRYHDAKRKGLIEFARTGRGNVIGKSLELTALRKDGTEFPVELSATAYRDSEGFLAVALVRNITERKQTEIELQQTRRSAEAANRAKSAFLANMSHEIRTPMTAILGFAENLLEPDLSESDKASAIETIRGNGEYLLGIINDILDLSKIEAGKIAVERIRCNPCQVVAEVVSLMSVRAEAKQLPLGIEYLGAIPETIQSDPTRLRQILINLLSNAIKFTHEGGVRLITRFIDDARKPLLQFDVLDTGIGMTAEQAATVFEAFAQADASTTRKYGGTGLGMAISKRLAEALGGEVIVVDTREGVGTRFRVTVATGALEGVRMLADPASATVVHVDAPEAAATTREPGLDGCRILLVEDGPDNQKLISFILKKAGAEVTIAENGREAVEKVAAATFARRQSDPPAAFDVILMDMQMPVMDGYKATRVLREKDFTRPIIALTAHAMASDREKCLKAGCDDYVTKPINRKKLIDIIQQCRSPVDMTPQPA